MTLTMRRGNTLSHATKSVMFHTMDLTYGNNFFYRKIIFLENHILTLGMPLLFFFFLKRPNRCTFSKIIT